MNFLFILLNLLIICVFSSCYDSVVQKKSTQAEILKPDGNLPLQSANTVIKNDSEYITKSVDIKTPVVWSVYFESEEFFDSSNYLTVSNTEEPLHLKLLDSKSKQYKKHGGVPADLINCGGYLASGIIYDAGKAEPEDGLTQWRFRIDRKTVAKDAVQKINQCAIHLDRNDSFEATNFNRAFAVASSNKQRTSIVTAVIADTSFIFASLPEDIKNWANSNVKNSPPLARTLDKLSLRDDSWADSDGDGIIDLIEINGFTEDDKGRSSILWLNNRKWKEIVKVQSE